MFNSSMPVLACQNVRSWFGNSPPTGKDVWPSSATSFLIAAVSICIICASAPHSSTLHPPNQAVGRVRRFGQQHTVQVIDYSNPGSFDLEQLNANSNKVVPQLIATLSIYRDTKLRPDDLEEELSLGQWVKVGNKLMPVEQARDNGVQYSDENLLNEDQLIVALNKALAGQEFELSNVPGFAVQYGLEDDDEEKEEDSGEERSPSDSGLMGQSNLPPLSDDEFGRSAGRRTSSEWRAI